MKRWFPALVLCTLLWSGGFAWGGENFQAGMTFGLGSPQADFGRNIDRLGVGGGGYFLYRLPESPLYVGLSAGVQVYGYEAWTEVFSPTFPDIIVDARTRNYILHAHLMVRLQPGGDFRPFVEGLFGLNHLWTETSLYDEGGFDNGEFASSVNFSDTALSYGAGAGIQLTVLQVRRRSGERTFAMDVELGARYINGGRAEYLRKGSITREAGEIFYDVLESATSLLSARAGLCFRF